MKKISILVPCYNEVENVELMCHSLVNVINETLSKYDYEIVFIDNCSTDGTREVLEKLCAENYKVKAIFNVTNFGQFNSPFYGMCQTTGDCTISVCCDFQDPIELIPRFVEEWEKGYKIVSGIKTSSKENRIVYFLRSVYYKVIKNMSSVKMIEHFTGFGLYDRTFIELLRQLDDPVPFLRGIVAEYGFKRKDIEYEQAKRRAGKTHNNFYTLYDAAMLSITSYTKVGLRLATFLGFIGSAVSLGIAVIYLIMKLANWYKFQAGYAPMIIGIFVIGSIQLFFIGLLGEYILNINTRVIHRPLVVGQVDGGQARPVQGEHQVPLHQAERHRQHRREHDAAQVEQAELGRAPLPLQHGADPIVEVAAQQQVEGVGAVGHHHEGDQPPHLAPENVRRPEAEQAAEHPAGEQVQEKDGHLGDGDVQHQVGDAEPGMLGAEPVDGTIVVVSVDQGKPSFLGRSNHYSPAARKSNQ